MCSSDLMNTDAELALARLFAEGAMGQPDFATAGFWFRNAGMHGAAEGAYAAGTYLEAGRGTRADPVDAAAWFSLAAELGHQAAPGSRDLLLRGFSAAQRTMYDQRVREFQEQRRTGDTTFHGVGPT